MSKFLPYEVQQTIVRDGVFVVDTIAECSTLDGAKISAMHGHNGNPTTHIHNVLNGETWVNKKGSWTWIR